MLFAAPGTLSSPLTKFALSFAVSQLLVDVIVNV